MYLSEGRDMMVDSLPPHQQHQLILAESSGGEDQEIKVPKKRAETWVQDETRTLISLRREVDGLFNTSKSNKHLWEQISGKMKGKGFDRSPTMCTDKWRNLLKEFKKARYQRESGGGPVKMSCFMEMEELLRCRTKHAAANSANYKSQTPPCCVNFSEKGFEDISIPFGSIEATDRSTVNLEQQLDHDADPLAITTTTDAVGGDEVPPWSWRETSGNGGEENHSSYGGKVISVKYGDFTRRIGIDGTADAIKEAIKSAFRLRSKRAFWLEDVDQVVRSLDRDMPLGNYTLHLDEGITIKLCLYNEAGTQDKTLYTEDDLRDFLSRRGWTGLRELNRYRCIDTLDDLQSGVLYQGVRLVGD